jgi:hypothetical protein
VKAVAASKTADDIKDLTRNVDAAARSGEPRQRIEVVTEAPRKSFRASNSASRESERLDVKCGSQVNSLSVRMPLRILGFLLLEGYTEVR